MCWEDASISTVLTGPLMNVKILASNQTTTYSIRENVAALPNPMELERHPDRKLSENKRKQRSHSLTHQVTLPTAHANLSASTSPTLKYTPHQSPSALALQDLGNWAEDLKRKLILPT